MKATIPVCLGVAMLLAAAAAVDAAQNQVIYSVKTGKGTLTLASDEAAHQLTLRFRTSNKFGCVEKEAMLSALKEAFSKMEEPKPDACYKSLSIGNAVDYPWLSQYLATVAAKDPAWNKKRGKPVDQEMNAYITNLLSRPEVVGEIDKSLAEGGYRVDSVEAERVLVDDYHNVPMYQGKKIPGRIPFDAMIRFKLARIGQTPAAAPGPELQGTATKN